jgi:hypothetical protein
MSPYDVTPDDDPLDVAAVSADDVGVEKLRHALSPDGAVVWDDDDDEIDPAFALLRALQVDVAADLPSAIGTILPPGVTELLPRRRHLGRGATIAAVAAGVLSIGGVAAAATPGHPLAGIRSAVSSAVANVIDSITPDSPVGPAVVEATHAGRPSPKPTPPGEAVSAAARSLSAVTQVTANLDRAAAFLDQGKYQPAENQLDAAARKLDYVLDTAVHARLASRLASLRALLATHPAAKPSHGPDGKASAGPKPGKDDNGKGSGAGQPAATRSPKAVPTRSPHSGSGGSGSGRAAETPEPKVSKTSSD